MAVKKMGLCVCVFVQVGTAVGLALSEDRVDILTLLEPSFANDMFTLLHFACINGAVRCADWLLSQPRHQATVNHHDSSPHKSTPLMIAVRQGLELTQLLLDHGAKANTVSPVTHQTAMHYLLSHASVYSTAKARCFLSSDFVDILLALVVAGCDVNAVDISGDTALSLLCMHPYTNLFIVNSSSVARYDKQIHRQLLLDAANLLIDHGATAATGLANSALDVLTQFVKFIVMRKCRAFRGAYVISVMTSRDLLMVIGQRCDAVFSSSNPATTALTLVQYMSRPTHAEELGSRYDGDDDDCVDDEDEVIRDVCRVLMLLSSPTQLLASVTATVEFFLANTCADYGWILFLIRCHISLSRSVDSVLLSLNDRLAANDRQDRDVSAMQRKRAAVQLVVDSLSQPRSLKQTSRLAILNNVQTHQRLSVINGGFGLPMELVRYVLSPAE